MFIGIDVGSVSIKTVILDPSFKVVFERYERIKGRPFQKVLESLREVFSIRNEYNGIALTGSGGKLLASIIGANFVNEIISHARGVEHFCPQVRTILDLGGEDSKIIELSPSENGKFIIKDFSMNTMCAAGTGSFLDQQASRLGYSIEEEFGRIAAKCKNPPRIAGRCSVFAKSDMIHLQQEATPDHDIIAGLCFSMIRNLKGTQGKGRALERPFSLQGGVAANAGIVRAVREIFELTEGELIIPEHYASMGAIGCIIHAFEDKESSVVNSDIIGRLEKYLSDQSMLPATSLEPLKLVKSIRKKSILSGRKDLEDGITDIYLGIDIGSISTNVVAIDSKGLVLSKRYLMTSGRPIEAVSRGLKEVNEELLRMGMDFKVRSAGTTGSGRYMIGKLLGADIVRNEITAQARAAIMIDPEVDTIFEIGGQDSKYISLDNGVVIDFEMNKVCAAGTGSFLEEQAEKLGISIEEEFGDLALSSSHPSTFGERCTVFMESDIVAHQQKGVNTEDLVGGLSYSIVYNYLNRVVGNKRVGENIFFQGGVAYNDGVLAAFESVTGKKITIPPHHEVFGAIGIALIARDNVSKDESDFTGFDFGDKKIKIDTFECKGCNNMCEIKKVNVDGQSNLFFGSRCDKYDLDHEKKDYGIPDLFKIRDDLLMKYYNSHNSDGSGLKLGIPRALTYFELFPMYSAFFIELGFEIILSDRTNKKIINFGSEMVNAEVCLPVKVAHGHVQDLVNKGIKRIFMPSVIDMDGSDSNFSNNFNCPYVQTLPYLVKAAIGPDSDGVEFITPVLRFQLGENEIKRTMQELGSNLGFSRTIIRRAVEKALDVQKEFRQALSSQHEYVEKLLREHKNSVVFVSRAYNGFDPGLNFHLSSKFMDLGILPIPLDFLPLERIRLAEEWENMYWQYGQKFLKASEYIKDKKDLFSVYITNFSCGPDSFLITFFKKTSGKKPFLQIEFDEHSADAGIITRCEAFVDSLDNISDIDEGSSEGVFKVQLSRNNGGQRKVYIPRMSDHAFAIEAAFKYVGIDAEIMEASDSDTLYCGRKYTTGKECFPCIVTTGDIIKTCLRDDFIPEESAFFMPSTSGPCRFGQYNKLQQIVVEKLGYSDVIFLSPNQHTHEMYSKSTLIPQDFFLYAWQGVVAIDYFDKLLRKIRPYEVNENQTNEVYRSVIESLCRNIGSGKLLKTIEGCVNRFKAIPVDISSRRPLIGVVGEVFVRMNSFSNNDIVKKVEDLGGEVIVPPIIEWINYTNYTHVLHALENKEYFNTIITFIKNLFLKRQEFQIAYLFRDLVVPWREISCKKTIKYGEKYISSLYRGEAILSIGKSIEYMNSGISGVINTMPFTCMPGTIVASILKKVRSVHRDFPVLNVCYDGQDDLNELNRLEAFMYQTHQHEREGKLV